VKGVAMRRVALPPDSPRGGIMTQASIPKSLQRHTTSPVLRGKWILGAHPRIEIPPRPPRAVEPDIAVRHHPPAARKAPRRPSCATCHSKRIRPVSRSRVST